MVKFLIYIGSLAANTETSRVVCHCDTVIHGMFTVSNVVWLTCLMSPIVWKQCRVAADFPIFLCENTTERSWSYYLRSWW